MKKLFLIVLFFIISTYAYANGKILKSGFFTKSASVEEGMDVKDTKNKIIALAKKYNYVPNLYAKTLDPQFDPPIQHKTDSDLKADRPLH